MIKKLKSIYTDLIGPIKPAKVISALFPFLKTYPDVIEIEITNFCNLHCIMCGSNYMKRKRGFISFGFYKKIIDDVSGKVKSVSLYSTGEPLLHKKLPEMIRYAKSRGIREVAISTNAMLLTEEIARKLISAGLDTMQVSVEGSTRKEYEMIRKGADFFKVRKNIRNFLSIRGKGKKPRIMINLLIHKDTNLTQFARTWRDFCDEIIVSEMQPITFFDEKTGRIVPVIPVGIGLCLKSKRIVGCNMPFVMAVVGYDGKVGMCCADFDLSLSMGDAKKESIIKIFNNSKYETARRNFLFKKFAGTQCEGCPSLYAGKDRNLILKSQEKIDGLMRNI
ncbi:MAG: radical SAM protein [Candidatus Woesearchaeota archaeon]|nr:radical SAM protein [Candidatus Woesearchaeota archaeon]